RASVSLHLRKCQLTNRAFWDTPVAWAGAQIADSAADPLRLSRLAEGFGEAGVVELVVALHLAVRQLEDVDPGARADLAGLSNAEADIAHRDDGLVLGDHRVHRVVRHVH